MTADICNIDAYADRAEADAERQQVEHRLEEARDDDEPVVALRGEQPAAEGEQKESKA